MDEPRQISYWRPIDGHQKNQNNAWQATAWQRHVKKAVKSLINTAGLNSRHKSKSRRCWGRKRSGPPAEPAGKDSIARRTCSMTDMLENCDGGERPSKVFDAKGGFSFTLNSISSAGLAGSSSELRIRIAAFIFPSSMQLGYRTAWDNGEEDGRTGEESIPVKHQVGVMILLLLLMLLLLLLLLQSAVRRRDIARPTCTLTYWYRPLYRRSSVCTGVYNKLWLVLVQWYWYTFNVA